VKKYARKIYEKVKYFSILKNLYIQMKYTYKLVNYDEDTLKYKDRFNINKNFIKDSLKTLNVNVNCYF